jgi:hypothetical protein
VSDGSLSHCFEFVFTPSRHQKTVTLAAPTPIDRRTLLRRALRANNNNSRLCLELRDDEIGLIADRCHGLLPVRRVQEMRYRSLTVLPRPQCDVEQLVRSAKSIALRRSREQQQQHQQQQQQQQQQRFDTALIALRFDDLEQARRLLVPSVNNSMFRFDFYHMPDRKAS